MSKKEAHKDLRRAGSYKNNYRWICCAYWFRHSFPLISPDSATEWVEQRGAGPKFETNFILPFSPHQLNNVWIIFTNNAVIGDYTATIFILFNLTGLFTFQSMCSQKYWKWLVTQIIAATLSSAKTLRKILQIAVGVMFLQGEIKWQISIHISLILSLCLLYNCGRIFFILSFFVGYISSFGLVRLRTFQLSARVGAHIERRCSFSRGEGVTITDVIIKTPDRKMGLGVWMTSCPEAMGWDSWVFWKKQLVEIWT